MERLIIGPNSPPAGTHARSGGQSLSFQTDPLPMAGRAQACRSVPHSWGAEQKRQDPVIIPCLEGQNIPCHGLTWQLKRSMSDRSFESGSNLILHYYSNYNQGLNEHVA